MRSTVTERVVYTVYTSHGYFSMFVTLRIAAQEPDGLKSSVACHKKSIIVIQPVRPCRSHARSLQLPHAHRTHLDPQPHLHGCRAKTPTERSHEMRSVALLPPKTPLTNFGARCPVFLGKLEGRHRELQCQEKKAQHGLHSHLTDESSVLHRAVIILICQRLFVVHHCLTEIAEQLHTFLVNLQLEYWFACASCVFSARSIVLSGCYSLRWLRNLLGRHRKSLTPSSRVPTSRRSGKKHANLVWWGLAPARQRLHRRLPAQAPGLRAQAPGGAVVASLSGFRQLTALCGSASMSPS